MTILDADIRGILTTKGTAQELAEKFGVSTQTIWLYKRLEVKKVRDMAFKLVAINVTMDLWPQKRKTPKFHVIEIAEIQESSDTSKTLAEKYNCSPSMIRMIKTGKTYV